MQVIDSLRPVGKFNLAGYPPSVIQITLGSASWNLDDFGWISGLFHLKIHGGGGGGGGWGGGGGGGGGVERSQFQTPPTMIFFSSK